MTAAAGRILLSVEDPQFAELSRTFGSRYDIEATEDGRFVLTPKLTAAAAEAWLGGRELTDEEFEQHFGHLPAGPA